MRTEMIRKFDLTGKKAIITGVGSLEGIGRYLAEGLCEAGAQVVLVNRSERMYKVRDLFRERGFSADGVVADLTDRVQLDDAFRQSMELLGGRLDILVNCAGMQKRMDSVDFSREDWDRKRHQCKCHCARVHRDRYEPALDGGSGAQSGDTVPDPCRRLGGSRGIQSRGGVPGL